MSSFNTATLISRLISKGLHGTAQPYLVLRPGGSNEDNCINKVSKEEDQVVDANELVCILHIGHNHG
jgi:hypothetical protein